MRSRDRFKGESGYGTTKNYVIYDDRAAGGDTDSATVLLGVGKEPSDEVAIAVAKEFITQGQPWVLYSYINIRGFLQHEKFVTYCDEHGEFFNRPKKLTI